MLRINELKVRYGGIEAVKGITFEVPEGKIVTLIGANGAGKSTILRTAAGLVKPIIHTTFPLAEAAQAQRLMESSDHLGKILLLR